ncbi:hypothetical protein G7Y89_g3961 [Cudoniella acicularis]|uniref:Uncharacterized protein n=1 Tax=Cudoniella acicularis TaxID=354080 RepID=A0A8H4RQD0_9HELO|nr:hypothetical protein G7Y89_g3961 [Cudoniella acicularis]
MGALAKFSVRTPFINNVAPTIQPFGSHLPHNPISTIWGQHTLANHALLEAILFHAAVHLDLRHRRPWSPITFYYRGQSIRLLNQSLESANGTPGDAVIGAAAFLGATGNITGNVDDDIMHRKATQKMVKMRGGLKNLGWDGALAMLLSIGDSISAIISASEPFLDCPSPKTAPPFLQSDIGNTLTLVKPSNTNLDLSLFGAEIHSLINRISKLASLHSNSYNELTSITTAMIAFNQYCSAVEHRLLSIKISVLEHASPQNPDIFIYEAARFAGLMCMTYLFRQMMPQGEVFTSLQMSLRNCLVSLEDLELAATDESSTQLLLWACCVGGLTSVDQDWFVERIYHCMSRLSFGNWEELELCLMQYVWTPRMCTEHFVAQWREVQILF